MGVYRDNILDVGSDLPALLRRVEPTTKSSPDHLRHQPLQLKRSPSTNHGFEIKMWPGKSPVPREELIKQVKGVDALFCYLTDKIDEQVLESAGKLS
uniref:D-isomer specific 2-hydroxyacid dehydrogenase catalytic domain-containing protein n=1 Tax=Timema poppense TaxID=170557 RepID=A0A7R9CIA8_TIMPO|nr:unnamed protein product [Timema poppensis]